MKKHPALRRPHWGPFGHRLAIEPLESRLLLSVSSWSIDDQVTVADGRMTILGTDGEDSCEVAAGTAIQVTLNGETRQFDAAAIESITVVAGDGDTVVLHDTAGDDTIFGDPDAVRIVAARLTLEATGAGTVIVAADAGGVDVAQLSDSAGDDVFTCSAQTATMSGDGFSVRVDSVEYVHGYAVSGGDDVAKMQGSDTDERFVGKATWARLSGDGYALRAKFFEEIVVDGGGGADEAKLEDSAGDDTLHATPLQTTLLADGYVYRVTDFDAVHVYARNGGCDIANLHDSSGDDRYVATASWGKMIGEGYLVRAKFFDSVHAYADAGGYDTAQLIGTEGSDTFESYSTHSWLRGNGYEHRVGAFDYVFAKATGGEDEAVIHDSDGTDRVVVEYRTVTLTEEQSGTVRQAIGFDVATTRLSQEADEASVAEDTGMDSRLEWPSDGVVVYAADFLDEESPTWGIQDAIDSLPEEGGVVVLPEGTFTLRQGLVLPDGVTLRGSGENTVLVRPDHVETRLTTTAATGSTYVEVESAEGFRVGDQIAIVAYGQSGAAVRTIVKIEGKTVYLDAAISISATYAPEDYASLVNYFPLVRTAWDHEGLETAGVVVENLVLDGNLDESAQAWRIGAPALLHLEGAVDSTIRNVTVRNSNTGGIVLAGGHDNRVENTTVELVRGHGIFVEGEADAVVSGATVLKAGYATKGVAGDGIFAVGCSDILVENSVAEGCLRHGLHTGGDLNRGGVWTGNISRGNGENGFHFCWDNFDLTVTGNVLEDNGRYGVGGLGLGGDFSDYFNTVSDNLIRGNGREGIMVNGGSDNTITGNTIVDNSQLRLGSFSGILLWDAAFVVVSNNTIGTEEGEASQQYGVEEYGDADSNTILGNDVTGNVDGGIYVTGWMTVVAGNTGSVYFEEG